MHCQKYLKSNKNIDTLYIFPHFAKYNVIILCNKNKGGLMKIIAAIASILIIIGALNWGLYGIAKIDIIENFFGGWNNKIGRIVYILIGVAGLYSLLYVIFA